MSAAARALPDRANRPANAPLAVKAFEDHIPGWVAIDVELNGRDLRNISRILERNVEVLEAKLILRVKTR